jgi:MoaA/NifB/PqqE/SkfB family radical SAM enzyme
MEPAASSGLDSGNHLASPVAGTELLDRVRNSTAPIVWIGGPEPLHHPELGQLTRCIAGIGRHVFLETDGALLRSRVHEFRPVARLYLTLALHGLEQPHDLRAGYAGAFQAAMEGWRVARLSGFSICVHVRVHVETELREIAELIQFARSQDADGIVVSPAIGELNSANPDKTVVHRKTMEARKLIGSKWWELFSRLVEPVMGGPRNVSRSAEETGVRGEREARANEEGVRVA